MAGIHTKVTEHFMLLLTLAEILSVAMHSLSNWSISNNKLIFLSIHNKYTIIPAFSLLVVIHLCFSWDHYINTCRIWMPPGFGNPDFPKGLLGIELTMAVNTFTWCLHNIFPKWKPSGEFQWNSINQDSQLTFRIWNRMFLMHVLNDTCSMHVLNVKIVVCSSFSIGALWLRW